MFAKRIRVWLAYLMVLVFFAFVALAVPPFAVIVGTAMILCAIGAAGWGAIVRQRDARRWASISSFYTLTPEQFEQHVAKLFEYQGYSTMLTPRTGDQGVDVSRGKAISSSAFSANATLTRLRTRQSKQCIPDRNTTDAMKPRSSVSAVSAAQQPSSREQFPSNSSTVTRTPTWCTP